jgi:hypothetical protein
MFKYIAIALLLATVSCSKFQDTKTVLAEIDKDKFGNVMISAI